MIYSIGHSHHGATEFVALVKAFGIETLIDIRRQPRSRRHPQFERPALAATLAARGIEYAWWGDALGGRRVARPDSPHIALRDGALRGFADHMHSAEFRAAAQALAALAAQRPIAFMCAEGDPLHCHRVLLADYLELGGLAVLHITASHSGMRHVLNAALGDDRGAPVYNRCAQGDLFA